jgi:hypothetical protein
MIIPGEGTDLLKFIKVLGNYLPDSLEDYFQIC